MALKPHEKIINSLTKEALKPLGLFQVGSSRLWFDDNGWYLTLVEFQPYSGAVGVCLNVGIHFLWLKGKEYTSFDYSSGNSRESKFVFYQDDESFEPQVQGLVDKAKERVEQYRLFRDISVAKEPILQYKSMSDDTWGALNRAMMCYLSGDESAAEKYLAQLDPQRMREIRNWNCRVADYIQSVMNECRNKEENGQTFVENNIKWKREFLRANRYKRLPLDPQYG